MHDTTLSQASGILFQPLSNWPSNGGSWTREGAEGYEDGDEGEEDDMYSLNTFDTKNTGKKQGWLAFALGGSMNG